jgi:alpha-glucosidase
VWREYALDRQRGVPGSTYELYRTALRLRRAYRLGVGQLVEQARSGPADLVDVTVAGVRVVTNLGRLPVPVPAGDILIASGELTPGPDRARVLPPDTTVWLS